MSSNNVIAVIVALLPVAAPFLAALYKLLVAQLPVNKYGEIQTVVDAAVHAAEQVYAKVPGSSQAKREWVVARIQAQFGKKVPASLIEVLLEEAVSYLPKSAATPQPPSAI